MKKRIFTGSGVAIVTPMHADGSIDYEELGRIIEFQIENHTDAIITCGTTGEAATMTTEEHCEVIRYTMEKVAGRVPVIAGTGSNDTAFGIELSKEAEAMGVNGLLLVTPYYNKTSQKGLVEHFTAIANAVKIPCIVYNVPSRTGCNILPATYAKLAKVENIVAVKEANGNIVSVAQTIALCGEDLDIYSGEDSQTLPIMALGGIGVISVFANALPRQMHDLAAAMLDGDLATARKIQNEYIDLMEGFFMDVNPIPIKEAMNKLGFNCGRCRLPLTTMTDEADAALEALLRKHNLI